METQQRESQASRDAQIAAIEKTFECVSADLFARAQTLSSLSRACGMRS